MTEQYQQPDINTPDPDDDIRHLSDSDEGSTLEVDTTYFVDTSANPVSVMLPSSEAGGELRVKNTGGNSLTLTITGTDKIDGAGSFVLLNIYDSATLVSDGQGTWGIW